jgi:hypothetical protein
LFGERVLYWRLHRLLPEQRLLPKLQQSDSPQVATELAHVTGEEVIFVPVNL